MKKLNTNNVGRMPFWQKDIDWIQQAYTEPIAALVSELGIDSDYFIVSGCQIAIANGAISMTGGWIWWNGELLPVRALATTNIENAPWVRLTRVANYDPDGARSFVSADQSASTVTDVWQDDYIQPQSYDVLNPTESGVYLIPGAPTLRDLIARRSGGLESGWRGTTPILSGNNVRYKHVGRMVVLSGTVLIDLNNETDPLVTGLPVPIGDYAALSLDFRASDISLYVDGTGALRWSASTVPSSSHTVAITGTMYMAAEPYVGTTNIGIAIIP